MGVPLHVTDTPDGLHLGATGAKLVEVSVVTLLQQVLATTVSRELVTHPTREKQEKRRKNFNLHFPMNHKVEFEEKGERMTGKNARLTDVYQTNKM